MELTDHLMPSQIIRPDRGMLQKLQEYDKQLDAFFNLINERWTVVRWIPMLKYEGGWRGMQFFRQTMVPWPVLCVQDWDGGYMRLDERALYLLIGGDLQKIDNLDKWCNERTQTMMAHRVKQHADLQDDIRHLTKESKTQLMKAFEPFDRDSWGESAPPPVPMSHEPVEVNLDELTF